MVMYRYLNSLLFVLVLFVTSMLNAQSKTNDIDPDLLTVNAIKTLQPKVNCLKNGDDWEICVQFTPITHYERYTWMRTANPFGAQLQLCFTNGVQCQPTNPKVIDAFKLPFFTTVSNAMRGVPWETRTGQWPWKDSAFQSTSFYLKSAFNIQLTNDVYLQIVPLMYKENTNNQTAWLVNFAPIRVELKTNGDVEKIEQ